MSENILPTDPAPLPSGSDLEGSTQPASPVIPTAVEGSPRKKSPILLFVSLTLLSIVSVFAIYLFLQVRTLTMEATATPTPSPTPIASADPTAGWETYSNEKMKISLKYPVDNNLKVFNPEFNDLNFFLNTAQYDPVFLEVALLPNTELNDWYKKAYESSKQDEAQRPVLQRDLEIDDHISYSAELNQEPSGKVKFIFVPLNKDLYQFVIPITNNENQYQILSTFKFTN